MYVHADTPLARVLARARHESERRTVDKGVQKDEDGEIVGRKGKARRTGETRGERCRSAPGGA